MKRVVRTAAVVAVLGVALGSHPSTAGRGARAGVGSPQQADDESAAWFCPMHPDVTASESGHCPKCEMALVRGNPFDTREYLLDVRTTPRAVRAGIPFRMEFTVRHPGSDALVNDFEVVHDKRYHLFVLSQDMSEMQHIHPERQANGAWAIEVTLPKPGYYWMLSDFLPTGGSPQFVARPLVTAGFDGDLAAAQAHLAPDSELDKTRDGITASLSFEPLPLVAGGYGHLSFALTDATTGQPVTDLQPYLGAFGHTLVMSEDMRDAVHSHPSPDPESDVSRGHGGPRVTFEGYLPRPGVYRAWTQFLRNGRLTTFAYTFRVLSFNEAFLPR